MTKASLAAKGPWEATGSSGRASDAKTLEASPFFFAESR